MNFGRIAAAAVVAWIVSLGVGFVVNDVLLTGLVAANAPVMRPDADIMAGLPLGFVFLLVGFFALAYAYARGYEGGNGIVEGIRFGVTMAFIVIGFGVVWQYVMFPITASYAAALVVDAIVELALYGAIIGAIYKPAGQPSRKPAAV